jgi:putative flippase GtrA
MSDIRTAPEVIRRLVSRNVGAMLARNTVVGTSVFALDLLLLWMLVAVFGMPKLMSATVGFIVSTSVHYIVGRGWIFKGATRHVVSGYFYFLLSGGVGLAITIVMFAALTLWTPINYLVARVIVSLFAGLASFLLNAVFTFQKV